MLLIQGLKENFCIGPGFIRPWFTGVYPSSRKSEGSLPAMT